MRAENAVQASVTDIQCAQSWEDADVLVGALTGPARPALPGATLLSVCSAGDNALALLTLNPACVVTMASSLAEIACVELRIAAYDTLDHPAFLELMGARRSQRRGEIFDAVAVRTPAPVRAFWGERRAAVVRHGVGGVGRFERRVRLIQRWLLPFAHNRHTVATLTERRTRSEREAFYIHRWDTWRWRLLLNVIFIHARKAALPRAPAFIRQADGRFAAIAARRFRHAVVDLDPADNPYLHWMLHGTHGNALPLAWRAEHYATIRNRLDRLHLRYCSLDDVIAEGLRADGFNLSSVFEHMTPDAFADTYSRLLQVANPGARLVYWNLTAPRRMPVAYVDCVRRLTGVEAAGKAADKALFHSGFVVEEVMGAPSRIGFVQSSLDARAFRSGLE